MKREIKFRGKDYEWDWVYGDLIHVHHDRDIVMIQNERGHGSDVDIETVGQFTGLCDKNGTKIYEGDILVWGEDGHQSSPLVVEFRHGAFGYVYTEDWFHAFAGNTNFTFNPLDTDKRFEVIGNVYDNPELLRKEKNK